MVFLLTPQAVLLFSVAAFTSAVAVWVWRKHGQSSTTLSLLLLAAVIWTLGEGLDTGSSDLASKFFFEELKYLGIVAIPVIFTIYAFQQTGRQKWISRRTIALLSIVPLVSLGLLLTNEWHHLFFSQVWVNPINPYSSLNTMPGPGFILFVGYTFSLLLAAPILAAQMLLRSRQLYGRQAVALLLTAVFPWIFAVLFQFTNAFVFNPTPPIVCFVGAAVALVNPAHLHIEDIVSVARETVVESMGDAVIVLDENNSVVDLNNAAQKLTDCSKSQMVGSRLEQVFPDFPVMVGKEFQAAERQREFELVKADEHLTFDVGMSLISDRSGRVNCRVLVLHDVTERRRAEESLKHYSQHLEEVVEERTRKLRQAERMAAIGELAAMVGHDLRNPLTGIAAATYYVKTKASKLTEKEKDMLATIESSIDYSNKIINDLLEYSMQTKLDLSETDPKSLLKQALSHIETPAKIIVVDETTSAPRLKVDKEKMRRVFVNIIRNAFDAMPKGGTLRVESRKVKENVVINFSDTGFGMSNEVLTKLWEPLFTTKAKGMGFGLPISKRILEAHGGTISVESSPGKGSTFKVALPIEAKIKQENADPFVDIPEHPLSRMEKTRFNPS